LKNMGEPPQPYFPSHGTEKQLADYAMIFDMLGLLTGITKEAFAINKIMEIFTMLFAPQTLIYLSISGGQAQEIKTDPQGLEISPDTLKRLQTFPENTIWTDWKMGFTLAIKHSGQTLGVVAINDILFVEHKDHYLNLAMAMAPVLALVISNSRHFNEKEELILKLKDALSKVKTLSGLLPICANCKKIRDDRGYWNRIEAYIAKHSDVQFTHGMCPDCARKLYPDLFEQNDSGGYDLIE
jgi:hypothetical protein